jgi:hypothetical protein
LSALARCLPFGVLACFFTLLLPRCSIAVGLDYLGNGECPAGTKLCLSRCEDPDPNTGCSASGCVPCILGNATARCGPDGQCAIAACIGSYQDCNAMPGDGCEVDTDHDPQHCGGCTAQPCVVPNAAPDCAAGHCAVRSCNTGFGDCNGLAGDGCEANLMTDSTNCGKCHVACATGTTCQNGACP